jgi:hypothetical protein
MNRIQYSDESNQVQIGRPFQATASQEDQELRLAGDGESITISDVQNSITIHGDGTRVEIMEQPLEIRMAIPGIQGPRGEQGERGPAGGPIAVLDDLNDVILVNLQGDQTLRYNPVLRVWQNSSVTDGGNF